MNEHTEQAALVAYARDAGRFINPAWDMIFAIPNGGNRTAITGAHLKREGVKPGVPDLFLAVARGPYFGLFIEMKDVRTECRVSEEQMDWAQKLTVQGYKVSTCYGSIAAIKIIEAYLALGSSHVLGDVDCKAPESDDGVCFDFDSTVNGTME